MTAPNGKSAYVTSDNDGNVAQYTINPTTGKITADVARHSRNRKRLARPRGDTRTLARSVVGGRVSRSWAAQFRLC